MHNGDLVFSFVHRPFTFLVRKKTIVNDIEIVLFPLTCDLRQLS